MATRPQPTRYSDTVARRTREMRRARGWTAQHLAELLTAAGCPIVRSTLAGLETGARAHITVEELYALAHVFGVPVDRLAHDDPVCPTCHDHPPAGFRCLACARERQPAPTRVTTHPNVRIGHTPLSGPDDHDR